MGYPRLAALAVFVGALVSLSALWHIYPLTTTTSAVVALAGLVGLFWATGRNR